MVSRDKSARLLDGLMVDGLMVDGLMVDGLMVDGLTRQAEAQLLRYHWPCNVRDWRT